MIEVSHLSKKYGTHPAIEDLSFTVGDGQIFGLLGPNGAGKSTIMNILTGYLAPTSGEVKVAGFSLPEQAQQAKACVGYLPEQPPLPFHQDAYRRVCLHPPKKSCRNQNTTFFHNL